MFRLRNIPEVHKFNLRIGAKVTSLAVPSLVQQFMTKEVTFFDGDDEKKAISFVDDIYMLLNQQRLLSAGTDTINAWLNTLTPKSDALSELRKKCTDEQLMQMCKSRYIQSQSELLAWSEYLNANADKIMQDVELAKQQAMQARQQAQQQEPPASPATE